MTGGWDRDEGGEPQGSSAIRPFLDRATGPVAHPGPGPGPDAAGDQSASVRPYYLTGGRVASADDRVRVETVVLAVDDPAGHLPAPAWEHRRLLSLATTPTSVVELAVAMAVPVGVALVLVGDLAREGLLELSTTTIAPRDDVALIRRLIDGVCAL